MAGLSDKVRERMRQQAQAIREGGGGGRTAPVFDLQGKNAVVQAGASVLARLCPRWDVARKFVRQGEAWVLSPEYQEDLIYFVALEHWWDDASGKPNREWCPKTFDEQAPCALCDASQELQQSPDKADREAGKRIQAKKAFLFNAVLGGPGKRHLTDDGKPDIRVLPMGNTLFVSVCGFMTGGDDEASAAFARGDISDPRDGYDLLLVRPKADSGERWTAQCAPQPSPLYAAAEAPAWAGWMDRLVDIPAMVEREVKGYDALYERYFGQRPPADDAGAPSTPAPAPTPPPFGGSSATEQPAPAAAPLDPWAAAGAPAPAAAGAAPFDPPPRSAAKQPPRRPSGRR